MKTSTFDQSAQLLVEKNRTLDAQNEIWRPLFQANIPQPWYHSICICALRPSQVLKDEKKHVDIILVQVYCDKFEFNSTVCQIQTCVNMLRSQFHHVRHSAVCYLSMYLQFNILY